MLLVASSSARYRCDYHAVGLVGWVKLEKSVLLLLLPTCGSDAVATCMSTSLLCEHIQWRDIERVLCPVLPTFSLCKRLCTYGLVAICQYSVDNAKLC